MRIRLLSDLHFEFGRPHKEFYYIDEDVLILAGDIAVSIDQVVAAIKYFKSIGFPHIVYVTGNHEYYKQDLSPPEFDARLKEELARIPNVYFLQGGEFVKILGVTFIGGTLWTNFGGDFFVKHSAKTMISDFQIIKNWSPNKAEEAFHSTFAHINVAYEMNPGKKVIVTHFMPAMEAIHPQYKDSPLNPYFSNDLGEYISHLEDTVWVFGHTHNSVDMQIGSTRLLCNPAGYYKREAQPDFNPELSFNV